MGERAVDWRRVVLLTVTGLLLVMVVVEVRVGIEQRGWWTEPGGDYRIYMEAARRWLSGDGFYLDRQLHGPYPIALGDVLYPPTALYLFVPFTFLPALLWWAIPIGLTAWIVRGWRPRMTAWPLMAASLAFPITPLMLIRGTPTIWIMVAIAGGLRWGWPGALVLLKPSVLPFALVGIRSRGWWMALGFMALATLPAQAMLPDWLHAVFDGRGWGGSLYSLHDVPLLLVPVVAWFGRDHMGPDGR
jgi:hypothetical protein